LAVWKCKSGESCEVFYPTIGKEDPVLDMQTCQTQILATVFLERFKTCLTWQRDGVMQHLLKQFPSFTTLNSHLSQIKLDEARVPRCDPKNEVLFFSDSACWYDGSDMVFLKPDYRFNFKQSTNAQVCVVSHDAQTHSDVTVVDSASTSYDNWFLDYVSQVAASRTIFYKNVQWYDYRLERRNTICPDLVTRPCFDNAFSFFGKACGWVHASSRLNGDISDFDADFAAVHPRITEFLVQWMQRNWKSADRTSRVRRAAGVRRLRRVAARRGAWDVQCVRAIVCNPPVRRGMR
jgi:hypothetical protein